MSRAFDPGTLELLDRTREVQIVTTRPDGKRPSTTIWVVVDDGEPYIRSYRGDRALWYRDALERPDGVELQVAELRLPVRPVPATDDLSVARCSSALERKYACDPSTPAMVGEAVIDTTLRLEPR
ncbi:MAG TPA: DUF2255 family protein [Candidatus Limnocylindrales bacterium]|nr:DUF2255 family protein [Candidatus Limnocylindrales bacterium]